MGGTPGGLGLFLFGLAMLAAGLYLLFQQVDVHGGYFAWGGWNRDRSFGLTLLPLLIGVGLLFWDGASKAGWLLAGGGLLLIVVGIVSNLQVHFRTTTLFNTLLILAFIAAGLGMMLRSMRPVRGRGRAAPGDGGDGGERDGDDREP
ncbi:MAG TPA: hypothetical protein VHE35_08370 [Kofleriaceae bacterium]|nr:hypothetical protein [Kofleriaceae bacterium]